MRRAKKTRTRQVNANSSTITEKESYGLGPKSARVSVGIPASYYEKVWRERNPVKEGEEAKKPDDTAIGEIRKEIRRNVRTKRRHAAATGAGCERPVGAGYRDHVSGYQAGRDCRAGDDPADVELARAQNWRMVAIGGAGAGQPSRCLRSMLRSSSGPGAGGEHDLGAGLGRGRQDRREGRAGRSRPSRDGCDA